MEQGKQDEAIVCFRTAIEIAPKSASAHSNLGVALLEQGKPDEAIACFRTAIEIDPKYAPARSHLGAALMKQGKQDEAIACYRKVIELDPKSAEIHNSLAWLLATSPEEKFRDPAGAVELAMKAIEQDPQQGGYWNTLGVARYRVGDWNEGIHALKQSNELMKGESFSFNAFFLAMAHWQLDEKDEAGKWYKQAVDWMEKNQPQDEELVRFRAEAAELLGIAEDVLPAPDPAVN